MNKTKYQIISESIEAANACLNYYSGQKLNVDQKCELFNLLQNWFPQLKTTENYNQIAKDYQERVENEV